MSNCRGSLSCLYKHVFVQHQYVAIENINKYEIMFSIKSIYITLSYYFCI